ncbi:MAG TPA: hypothetical protein DDW82_06390 [Acholeplasmataceae bacterium]|nr:hypothetical protein [Acholeplasmataceae bacterium]
MKKYVMILILLIVVTSLSACTTTGADLELAKIIRLVEGYETDDINGFNFSSTQYSAEQELNFDIITQRIERGTEIKAYTEFSERRFNAYNDDDQFSDTNYVLYYYNNQIGTQIGDEPTIWSATTIEEYFVSRLPIVKFLRTDFITYEISQVGTQSVLNGTVKTNSISKLLGFIDDTITTLEIKITYSSLEAQLIEVEIRYEQSATNTVVIYTPFYGTAQVVLPTN